MQLVCIDAVVALDALERVARAPGYSGLPDVEWKVAVRTVGK